MLWKYLTKHMYIYVLAIWTLYQIHYLNNTVMNTIFVHKIMY